MNKVTKKLVEDIINEVRVAMKEAGFEKCCEIGYSEMYDCAYAWFSHWEVCDEAEEVLKEHFADFSCAVEIRKEQAIPTSQILVIPVK